MSGFNFGGGTNVNSSSSTVNISKAVVQVEQFCQANASNTINISIQPPQGTSCTTGGVDIINPTISQNADSQIQSCSNQSYYEALLRLAITNNLSASQASQLTNESLAGLNVPNVGVLFNNSVTTNAYNATTETTDYSSLQQCRGAAQNLIQINVTDCAETREIGGTLSQTSTANLVNCVNNSSAVTNFQLNFMNLLSSSNTTTNANPLGQIFSEIGNIIMIIAIAIGVCGTIVAIASAVTTTVQTRAKAHLMERELEIRGSIGSSQNLKVNNPIAKSASAAAKSATSAAGSIGRLLKKNTK